MLKPNKIRDLSIDAVGGYILFNFPTNMMLHKLSRISYSRYAAIPIRKRPAGGGEKTAHSSTKSSRITHASIALFLRASSSSGGGRTRGSNANLIQPDNVRTCKKWTRKTKSHSNPRTSFVSRISFSRIFQFSKPSMG